MPHFYSPYQLLRPPGLCKLVCPIFTTPIPNPGSLPAATENTVEGECRLSVLEFVGKSPTASIIGLGAAMIIEGAETSAPDPLTRTGVGDAGEGGERCGRPPPPKCRRGEFDGVEGCVIETGRSDSAYHSYHTLWLLVSRHIDTCSSELLGRYSAS